MPAIAQMINSFASGNINGNRLEIGSFKALFGVEKTNHQALFELGLLDGLIVMKFDEADGFISRCLGKGIESNFDAGVGFSNNRGFYFTGSSGLELTIPTQRHHRSTSTFKAYESPYNSKTKSQPVTWSFHQACTWTPSCSCRKYRAHDSR